MKYRNLRIAWSVWWGVVAVLLIVLWVRSYWVEDYKVFFRNWDSVTCLSVEGVVSLQYSNPTVNGQYLFSNDADEGRTVKWFDFSNNKGLYNASVPHWFLASTCATLVTLPWLPYRSKRFSLRTLFFTTTAVALLFGLIIYATRG